MSDPTSVPPPELRRILVLDDEKLVLTALESTLQFEGYEVFAVADPLEAVKLLGQAPFSVILSDQQMPADGGANSWPHVEQRACYGFAVARIADLRVLHSSFCLLALRRKQRFRLGEGDPTLALV
jgi:CheY-like chemotaxis protein